MDGTLVRATNVLANTTPHVTFRQLLAEDHLPPEFRLAVDQVDYSSVRMDDASNLTLSSPFSATDDLLVVKQRMGRWEGALTCLRTSTPTSHSDRVRQSIALRWNLRLAVDQVGYLQFTDQQVAFFRLCMNITVIDDVKVVFVRFDGRGEGKRACENYVNFRGMAWSSDFERVKKPCPQNGSSYRPKLRKSCRMERTKTCRKNCVDKSSECIPS